MKLAIHNGLGYNVRLIDFCKKKDISFLLVDSYRSDIIDFLKTNNVTHFFWHFHHILHEDIMMSRNLLYSLEKIGIIVYPNFNTCWYFDDKVSEKYILEALEAPLVNSYAFYHHKEAVKWLKTANFPLVAKLRRGAGSYNVIKINDYSEALSYCNKMFGNGISPAPRVVSDIKSKVQVSLSKKSVFNSIKKIPRFIKNMKKASCSFPNEKGYVLFQDFIQNNGCDYRVVVVNNKAWGSYRPVRKDDFRASGAGLSVEDPSLIPLELVEIAFDLVDKLDSQSMSFDFVLDLNNCPHIVEISYCFGFDGGDGTFYWDRNLNLHKSNFTIEEELYNVLFKI